MERGAKKAKRRVGSTSRPTAGQPARFGQGVDLAAQFPPQPPANLRLRFSGRLPLSRPQTMLELRRSNSSSPGLGARAGGQPSVQPAAALSLQRGLLARATAARLGAASQARPVGAEARPSPIFYGLRSIAIFHCLNRHLQAFALYGIMMPHLWIVGNVYWGRSLRPTQLGETSGKLAYELIVF